MVADWTKLNAVHLRPTRLVRDGGGLDEVDAVHLRPARFVRDGGGSDEVDEVDVVYFHAGNGLCQMAVDWTIRR